MNDYTFEMMYEDLRNGYQIYYTYVKNRYLLFRTAKNCYTQKLITEIMIKILIQSKQCLH